MQKSYLNLRLILFSKPCRKNQMKEIENRRNRTKIQGFERSPCVEIITHYYKNYMEAFEFKGKSSAIHCWFPVLALSPFQLNI